MSMTREELTERLRIALLERQHRYKQIFKGPNADAVLFDLARFCRANESTFNPDPYLSAVAEGRREVWLRIQRHLQLSPADLWALYSGVRE